MRTHTNKVGLAVGCFISICLLFVNVGCSANDVLPHGEDTSRSDDGQNGDASQIEEDKINTYDTIIFGEWRNEPIVWRILDVQGQNMLIVSDEILTLRQYDEALSYPSWLDSSLRSWLNNDFYQAAFSPEEKQVITQTLIQTPDIDTVIETPMADGSVEKTPILIQGSEDTEDKIFCLSFEEVSKYFCTSDDRVASMTVTQSDFDYAVQVAEAIGWSPEEWWYIYGGYELNEVAPKIWWLRSGTYVDPYGNVWMGSITDDGDIPQGWPCGVRPAMWIQPGAD